MRLDGRETRPKATPVWTPANRVTPRRSKKIQVFLRKMSVLHHEPNRTRIQSKTKRKPGDCPISSPELGTPLKLPISSGVGCPSPHTDNAQVGAGSDAVKQVGYVLYVWEEAVKESNNDEGSLANERLSFEMLARGCRLQVASIDLSPATATLLHRQHVRHHSRVALLHSLLER